MDWRTSRKHVIDNFENDISKSIEEHLKILPTMHERAKACGMSTEEYLRYWIYNGLAPGAMVKQ